jgi:hypothetical protein
MALFLHLLIFLTIVMSIRLSFCASFFSSFSCVFLYVAHEFPLIFLLHAKLLPRQVFLLYLTTLLSSLTSPNELISLKEEGALDPHPLSLHVTVSAAG